MSHNNYICRERSHSTASLQADCSSPQQLNAGQHSQVYDYFSPDISDTSSHRFLLESSPSSAVTSSQALAPKFYMSYKPRLQEHLLAADSMLQDNLSKPKGGGGSSKGSNRFEERKSRRSQLSYVSDNFISDEFRTSSIDEVLDPTRTRFGSIDENFWRDVPHQCKDIYCTFCNDNKSFKSFHLPPHIWDRKCKVCGPKLIDRATSPIVLLSPPKPPPDKALTMATSLARWKRRATTPITSINARIFPRRNSDISPFLRRFSSDTSFLMNPKHDLLSQVLSWETKSPVERLALTTQQSMSFALPPNCTLRSESKVKIAIT